MDHKEESKFASDTALRHPPVNNVILAFLDTLYHPLRAVSARLIVNRVSSLPEIELAYPQKNRLDLLLG